MSPRQHRPRKVSNPPIVSGMKPYGFKLVNSKAESVFLHLEEYEALRLCDHEGLNHLDASRLMDVSRPTLTRIYARAKQKVAAALVEGRQIIIEGGKVFFDSDWYACTHCGCFFNHPDKHTDVACCALCGSREFTPCENNPEGFDEFRGCGKGYRQRRHKKHP